MFLAVCSRSESMKDPFKEAELLPMLKKMLEDPVGAVEVKFSALGLICSLAKSGMCCRRAVCASVSSNKVRGPINRT